MPDTSIAVAEQHPTTRVCQYNGYSLPNIRNIDCTMEMKYDDADFSRTYSIYRYTISFLLNEDTESSTANDAQTIRGMLTRPGGTLTITGIGFGDINLVGMTKSTADIKWGPKPRVLKFSNTLGGGLGWWVVWEVEVALNDCTSPGQSGTYKALSAFNTTIVYGVDRGLATRSITGYYEIPLTRGRGADDPSVAYSADDFWSTIAIPVPFFMERLTNERRLSADRTRLEFQFVDREIQSDDVLPPGIIRGELTKNLENKTPRNFNKWNYTLTASFERKAGQPRDWAYYQFWLILQDEVQRLRSNTDPVFVGQQAADGKTMVFPEKIKISNNMFARTTDFSVTFDIVCNTAAVMAMTGMWVPVLGNNATTWTSWAASMTDAWSNLGINGYQHDATGDTIIDLCVGGKPGVQTKIGKLGFSATTADLFDCDDVDEENSWLSFNNWFETHIDNNVKTHYPAQKWNPTSSGSDGNDGDATDFDTDGVNLVEGSDSQAKSSISQYQGAPKIDLWMVGCCRRVKFKPVAPKLVSYQGYKVQEISHEYQGPKTDGSVADCNVWSLCWRIHYKVLDVPAKGTTITGAPTPFVSDQDNQ